MRMRSWRFHGTGNIRNLELEEINVPRPMPGELLVKTEYAALNPADAFVVMGRYPSAGTPPFSVGRSGCGVVADPGESSQFSEGDRVVLLRGEVGITREGTLAEYFTAPESTLAPIPHWWDAADGAAGPLVLLTNWQALKDASDVQSWENVVITGASGGIGSSAILLVKALGAEAIALSRGNEKREKLIEFGTDHVLDTTDPDLISKVKELGGADVVIENICGPFLSKSLDMCNMRGRICIIGGLGGVKSEINTMKVLFKRLQIHGIQVGEYSDEELAEAWRGIVETLEPNRVKVPIDKIYPFEKVHEAFAHLREGPMGKVVVGPMS